MEIFAFFFLSEDKRNNIEIWGDNKQEDKKTELVHLEFPVDPPETDFSIQPCKIKDPVTKTSIPQVLPITKKTENISKQ